MINPYLSIVVTARNDNHGGNLLKRMQLFINGVIEQANRHRVPIELILVEWNPPADKPGLRDALAWPENSPFADVRIIEVPSELHQRYKHADRLPLYQMIGKNVGIRRARAPFVLATNIDILFSDELFEYLALGKLESGRMYRVNRLDVDENIRSDASLDEQLQFCRENLIRVNHWRGSKSLLTDHYHRHCADDEELFLNQSEYPLLHTNACGDFQLMARSHWFELHGYPEFDMYSFHIDSIMQHMAHHGGAPEFRLEEPFRIYHIEHESGWTPEAQKQGTFDQRYEKQSIKKLSDQELHSYQIEMAKKDKPIIFNDQNWGLAMESLREIQLY